MHANERGRGRGGEAESPGGYDLDPNIWMWNLQPVEKIQSAEPVLVRLHLTLIKAELVLWANPNVSLLSPGRASDFCHLRMLLSATI